MVLVLTGIRDPVTTTSSISSWEKALGAAVATATAIAANAKLGFLDNDLIILASFFTFSLYCTTLVNERRAVCLQALAGTCFINAPRSIYLCANVTSQACTKRRKSIKNNNLKFHRQRKDDTFTLISPYLLRSPHHGSDIGDVSAPTQCIPFFCLST